MPELLSSKVLISEEDPKIRTFPTFPTAVPGMLGVTERGPIATPTVITSYEEFEKVYGSFINGREAALAARAFFLNGGKQMVVSRTCSYSNYQNRATARATAGALTLKTGAGAPSPAMLTGTVAGPWKLSNNDTLIASINSAADETGTFTGAAASVENATAEPYVIGAGQTLTVKIDGEDPAQTVTFDGAETTAELVAQTINAALGGAKATVTSAGTKITITSDRKGTGSRVEITGGTANGVLGFPTAPVVGTGNVANLAAVTLAEAKTILELVWKAGGGAAAVVISDDGAGRMKITTVLAGASASIEVKASSTCETIFGLSTVKVTGGSGVAQDTLKVEGKTPGAYFNTLAIKVSAASSGLSSEFDLQILKSSVPIETWTNLTMDTTSTRYVHTVINDTGIGSDYIKATDQNLPGTADQRRPADVSAASATTLGNDGLSGSGWALEDTDFTGSKSARTGVYAFDESEDITLLICPDRTTSAVQAALLTYAGSDRQGLVFVVLDPPASKTAVTIKTHKDALSSASLYYEMGALYWPRVRIVNPSSTIYGKTVSSIDVCPSGFIAGVMARDDRDEAAGPFTQPAGVENGKPVGVVALEGEDGTAATQHEARLEAKRDLVFPYRINPITYMKAWGVFIDGARTLKGDGNFPSVGERRGMAHLERLLQSGLQWVRHYNNTPDLREDVDSQVYALMYEWMQKGAFASKEPSKAFFVDVSDALNSPSVIRAGKLVMRVGAATNSPAEFIIIKVSKDTRALQEELFGT